MVCCGYHLGLNLAVIVVLHFVGQWRYANAQDDGEKRLALWLALITAGLFTVQLLAVVWPLLPRG